MDWERWEPVVRGLAFFGVLGVVGIAEQLWPRRARQRAQGVRWLANLGVVLLSQVVVGVLVPIAPVAFAAAIQGRSGGLLPFLGLTGWPLAVVAFVLLDLAIYLQHVLFHAAPSLWRLHAMHHADVDYDASTGLRFHPLEILLSLGIKLIVIAGLGAPPSAVLAFAMVLNACAMFNHANLKLPLPLDAALRWLLVTPDMHRVHHSTDPRETHRNFGFNLPWWDWLFGTYTAQPRLGHEGMEIGLPTFRDPREAWLDRMLSQPFRREQRATGLDKDTAG